MTTTTEKISGEEMFAALPQDQAEALSEIKDMFHKANIISEKHGFNLFAIVVADTEDGHGVSTATVGANLESPGFPVIASAKWATENHHIVGEVAVEAAYNEMRAGAGELTNRETGDAITPEQLFGKPAGETLQ